MLRLCPARLRIYQLLLSLDQFLVEVGSPTLSLDQLLTALT